MPGEEPVSVDVDGETVRGVLHLPDEASAPLVVICHGWSGNHIGPNRFFTRAARQFAEEGYAACRFDFRGSGDADGSFEEQTFTTMLQDMDAVVTSLRARDDIGDRLAIVGHSQGGYISLLHAGADEQVDAVVLWMARTADAEDWHSQPWKDELERSGSYTQSDYTVTKEYYEDATEYSIVERLSGIDAPIGMVYGGLDEVVPPAEGERVEEHAGGRVEMEVIDHLDHLFHGEENKDAVIQQTLDWLDRWV
ncbi:MAG: alpha/beta fold hydrolase [Candidatus Nanohaloarchaea archaeon]|nr:alpha/beta fold hydrolase [Candidatus Nanohaloarchaea archaeon]